MATRSVPSTRILLDGVELYSIRWYSLNWSDLYFEAELLTAGPVEDGELPVARLSLDLESAFADGNTLHLTSRRHRF